MFCKILFGGTVLLWRPRSGEDSFENYLRRDMKFIKKYCIYWKLLIIEIQFNPVPTLNYRNYPRYWGSAFQAGFPAQGVFLVFLV